MFGRPFRAINARTIAVHIPEPVRELVLSMTNQLRELLLVDNGEEIRRLYPTAYPEDEEFEADYKSMVHDQLLMARLEAIDTVEATISNTEISSEQADQWMGTINEIRLVLGTKLDVSEDDDGDIDPDDEDASSQVIYQVLTSVLGSLTDARIDQLSLG